MNRFERIANIICASDKNAFEKCESAFEVLRENADSLWHLSTGDVAEAFKDLSFEASTASDKIDDFDSMSYESCVSALNEMIDDWKLSAQWYADHENDEILNRSFEKVLEALYEAKSFVEQYDGNIMVRASDEGAFRGLLESIEQVEKYGNAIEKWLKTRWNTIGQKILHWFDDEGAIRKFWEDGWEDFQNVLNSERELAEAGANGISEFIEKNPNVIREPRYWVEKMIDNTSSFGEQLKLAQDNGIVLDCGRFSHALERMLYFHRQVVKDYSNGK